VGLTALLSLLTACGDEGRAVPAPQISAVPPSPVPSVSARSARAIADEEALMAYKGMVDAWVEAARTSDAGFPALARYSRDQALKTLVSSLHSSKLRKLVAKGAPGSAPEVIDARPVDAPTDVVVQDCFDTTNWLLYKASGELADDVPGERRLMKALVRNTDGIWKVDGLVNTDAAC
jgi:hypothetical protein